MERPTNIIQNTHALRFLIDFILVLWNFWWIEEVEERVVWHLFSDGSDSATLFMLLLLADGLHSQVLAFVPVDITAFAFIDFWSFICEWRFCINH